MVEPRVVVAHREDVWWLLSEAAQLEHMIMCQYLFAEFSLKQGTDEGLTAEQAEVVDRWRETLHSIAVEEMLHLALVANLSTAIGAAPTFGRPNFPQRSGYFPSPIQLDLQPFGEQALQHSCISSGPRGWSARTPGASFQPHPRASRWQPRRPCRAVRNTRRLVTSTVALATGSRRWSHASASRRCSSVRRVPRRPPSSSTGRSWSR